jgi:e3 binding domain
MADATPAAQKLAEEKGVDLDSLKGTGTDGRILVEDVEAAAEDQSSEESDSKESGDFEEGEKEVVGEVGGDDLVVEPADKSADSYLEHPHVELDEQSAVEKKDLTAAEDEVQLPGEEAPEVDEEEAEPTEATEAAQKAADEGESDEPNPDLLLSQDSILNRGERDRGFYVIPEQVNPYWKAEQEALAKEEDEVADPESSDSKKSGEDAPNTEGVEDTARPAQQEGVVDTSDAGSSPTHGESLKDKAPAVAEATEGSGSDS